MAKMKLFILLPILLFSLNVAAQDGRTLLTKIEREAQEKEPSWILEHKTANERGVLASWRHGEKLVRINIYIANSAKQAHKWYEGTGVRPKNKTGHITKLQGWGNEGAFVADYLQRGNVALIFRMGKVVVQAVGNSGDDVRRFAQHVLNQKTAI